MSAVESTTIQPPAEEIVYLDGPAAEDPSGSLRGTSDLELREGSISLGDRVIGAGLAIASAAEWLFGGISLLIGLAALATVPLLGMLSLGYLLEVSGRIARTGRLSEGFIGFRKASRVGRVLLGTALMTLPVWYVSTQWQRAALIDPTSPQTAGLRVGLLILTGLMALHVAAAWFNGGRLRDFLWPTFQWWFGPIGSLVCLVTGRSIWAPWAWLPPVRHLAALFEGDLYSRSRDAVWEFLVGLRLPYYFWLGLRGFAGGLLWLGLPVTLLVLVHQIPDPGAATLVGWIGGLLFIPVTLYLPLVQTRFAAEDRFTAFFEIQPVREAFQKAPLISLIAMTALLAPTLLLMILKVEAVPRELMLAPCLLYVAFLWPAKFLLGTAWGAAEAAEEPAWFYWVWPCRLLTLPLAASYVLLVYASEYTSWHGVYSLYEQHAFLLPAPFWSLPDL